MRGVTDNPQDAVIAKVVITMAHGLGLRVVGEGVETEDQCAFLQAHGCDEMQGYLFSRPVPAAALRSMLLEGRQLPRHLLARPSSDKAATQDACA